MIAKFNTSGINTDSKKGSNTLLLIAALALAGFLVYKYVIVPRQQQEEQNQ